MRGITRRSRSRRLALLVAVAILSGVIDAGAPASAGPSSPGAEIFRSAPSGTAAVGTVPDGFRDDVVWSGITWATALAFSPDGKVYVAQKNGVVKVFSSLAATTSTVFANVSYRTHDYWDRGLLGLVVDPQLGTPGHNFVYVLYTYDGAPPRWNDVCKGPPDGPGPTTDGCVVDARLSRFPVNPDGTAGIEQPLIDGKWCQQFPSHSIGHLAFLPDGSLVVSAGEGASFENPDYGQFGGTVLDPATGQPYTRANPCGDPPNGLGVANTAPTGRGGALRAQSLRRPAGEPTCSTGRSSASTQPPATGSPGTRCSTPRSQRRTRGGSWRTGSGTRSGSRSGPEPPRSGSGTSAWIRGRRSTGFRRPRRRRR